MEQVLTKSLNKYRRYLASNWRIDEALQTWDADRKLVRADHFFWALGKPTQKSREGLLRQILHSVLRSLSVDLNTPELEYIKKACKSRWDSSHSNRAWEYEELYDMLIRLTSLAGAKFLLLIDALDECDPQDRLGELADEILRISQLPNVKLCIACRPWIPFTSRFKPEQARVIYLEQLTYHDMEVYVGSRFVSAEKDSGYCDEFRGKSLKATRFIDSIVQVAEGVFLWIELVLKALCSELRKGSNFETLQGCLSEIPLDMDHYFQRLILDRVTRTRRNQSDTAAAFKLALQIQNSREIPPLENVSHSFLDFWLLLNRYLEPGFSWEDNPTYDWHSLEDIERMVGQTRRFLEEACKDLLVVVDRRRPQSPFYRLKFSEMEWDVQFLHRTVADFLGNDPVKSAIERHSPAHFSDESFLVKLHRLRSLHRLREQWHGLRSCRLHVRVARRYRMDVVPIT